MAQQTMRGIRLGNQSLESDVGVSYFPRLNHSYRCANGHTSDLAFAQDAELPSTWQCKHCSEQATLLKDGKAIKLEIDESKTSRTHYEMLLERRSKAELEEILKERLDYIKARRKSGKADV